VDGDKKANQVTRPERGRIASMLKDFRFTTKRTRPIGEAIITSGGVSTREVDPKTMESKLIKGLYIVGELLDVDGPTGGYNLQAAFSTGYACGDNI
jgi:predicted flavoprotein YhiN